MNQLKNCLLATLIASAVPACTIDNIDSTKTGTARSAVTDREPSAEHGLPPIRAGEYPAGQGAAQHGGGVTSGTWKTVATTPNIAAGFSILLTDGSVMVQDLNNGGGDWWKLAPDAHRQLRERHVDAAAVDAERLRAAVLRIRRAPRRPRRVHRRRVPGVPAGVDDAGRGLRSGREQLDAARAARGLDDDRRRAEHRARRRPLRARELLHDGHGRPRSGDADVVDDHQRRQGRHLRRGRLDAPAERHGADRRLEQRHGRRPTPRSTRLPTRSTRAAGRAPARRTSRSRTRRRGRSVPR